MTKRVAWAGQKELDELDVDTLDKLDGLDKAG